MNSTQNKKIDQVKETTMIVGIDVGSEKHYFRAFNWRGIELTRKPVAFSNSMEGFNSFYNTIMELMQKSELEETLIGIDLTVDKGELIVRILEVITGLILGSSWAKRT